MQPDPFKRLEARTLVVRQSNIDTDQIIPARFLTTTTREGLGANAFYDWRYTADDQPKNASPFPVAGADIADIFKSNSLKNGLLPVEVDAETHAALLDRPGVAIAIDLEECTLTTEDGIEASFSVEPFARRCLLDGVDPLGHILAHDAQIAEYEAAA